MRWLSFTILAIILVILQISFLPYFRIFGVLPDLILLVSLFLLIFRGFREAIFFGFLAGIMSDFTARDFMFGIGTFALVSAIILIEFLSRFSEKQDFRVAPILIIIATIFNQLFLTAGVFILHFFWSTIVQPPAVIIVKVLFGKIFYNLIAGLIIFFFIKYGKTIFGKALRF